MAAIVAMLGPAWQRRAMQRPWDAIVWWELRRIPYNVLMLVGVVVFGVFANLAYTLGWITELLWSWGDTGRTEPVRSRIFWMGVAFSVAVTLLLAFLIPLTWIVFGFQHQ